MIEIRVGDCRELLRAMPDASVHCCVTSPPYFGLRDYGVEGQIGREPSPEAFIAELVAVFREVRRALRDDGTAWVNMGDSYAPGKNLLGMPWRLAFALQADGWLLRQDVIWAKPNPMPESVRDRCTKAHEYVFLFSKSERYYFDAQAISEPAIGPAGGNTKPNRSYEDDPVKHRTKAGLAAAQTKARAAGGFKTRNRRSVWTVPSQPFYGAHFATMPPALVEPCVAAGCPAGGIVLDPFGGAGTTGLVADRMGRNAILLELNPEYVDIARRRIVSDAPLLAEVKA